MLTSEKSVMLQGSIPYVTVAEAREIAKALETHDASIKTGDRLRRKSNSGLETFATYADQGWMNMAWKIESRVDVPGDLWLIGETQLFCVTFDDLKKNWEKV